MPRWARVDQHRAAKREEAAGFLGMSPQILKRVYGHYDLDHLRTTATKIGYRHHGKPNTSPKTLAAKSEGLKDDD